MLTPVHTGNMCDVLEDVGPSIVHKLIPLEKAKEILTHAYSLNEAVGMPDYTHVIDHKWWMRLHDVGRKAKK